MLTFNIRAVIFSAPLLLSALVNSGLLRAAMQDPPPKPADGDIPTFSYKELVGIAHNNLAWQKYAGKTVGIYGARFFSISPFPNKTYMMGIVSSPYTSDISECMLAKESVPAAANFKLHDAVNIVVKLAPNPSDRGLPNYDSPCLAVPGAKKAEPQVAPEPTGPVTPEFTLTATQYFEEGKKNTLARDHKYIGKAIQLTGKVGNISEKDVQIDVFMYNRDIPVFDCFVNKESLAKVMTLASGTSITVTGVVQAGDYQGARKYNAILSNCTIK